jgi:hypothetical protein
MVMNENFWKEVNKEWKLCSIKIAESQKRLQEIDMAFMKRFMDKAVFNEDNDLEFKWKLVAPNGEEYED